MVSSETLDRLRYLWPDAAGGELKPRVQRLCKKLRSGTDGAELSKNPDPEPQKNTSRLLTFSLCLQVNHANTFSCTLKRWLQGTGREFWLALNP
jgi:hypothetical protein